MSYTISENGTALTEAQEGVTTPADYSFAAVNDFVHSTETHFEELQYLCLGMANHIEKLTKALDDINIHQEITGVELAKLSATWKIAQKATKVI